MTEKSKRDLSLDIIRISATFFVVSVHFFLYNGFYGEIMAGKRMYVMTLMRSFFMICVPLFILLTGYLMSGKKLSRKYYFGIVKTLSIYLIVSVIQIFYENYLVPGTYTLKSGIRAIFDFTAASYSWYIEMYIGLFILIPFLNLAYHGLSGQKQKLALIISCIVITSIPLQIMPNWWSTIYPLTYYFIGCYLKEYGMPISRKKCALLLPVSIVLIGSLNFYLSRGVSFQWGIWQDFRSILILVMAVLFFGMFAGSKTVNQKLAKFPGAKCLWYLSDLTLGAYLLSYLIDSQIYPIFRERVPVMTHRLEYYFIIAPFVFVGAMLLSAVVNLIYKAAYFAVSRFVFLFHTRLKKILHIN